MRRGQEVFERFETLGEGQIHVPKSNLKDTRPLRATSVLVWMQLLPRLRDKEKVIGDRGIIDSSWSLWLEHGRNDEKVPKKMRNVAD